MVNFLSLSYTKYDKLSLYSSIFAYLTLTSKHFIYSTISQLTLFKFKKNNFKYDHRVTTNLDNTSADL